MRRFEDETGAAWEVVAGRESWGAIYALFIPVDGDGMRQVPLAATGYETATAEIEAFTEHQLRELLATSQPKPMG